MTLNLHVCTIFFQPEVVYDVIPGWNIKTIEGYHVVNVEAASSKTLRDIPKKSFRDGGVGEATAADIDDSIKRTRFRVSLTNAKPTIIIRLEYNHCNEK